MSRFTCTMMTTRCRVTGTLVILLALLSSGCPVYAQITEGANRGEACDPSLAVPCKGKNNLCGASLVCECLNAEFTPDGNGNDCYECKDAKSCVDLGYHTDWRVMTCVFKTCFCTSGYATRGSGVDKVCVEEVCGQLPAISNGTVSQEGIAIGDHAYYLCHPGFELHLAMAAPHPRECLADGNWTGNDFDYTCVAKNCGPLPDIVNGTVTSASTSYPAVANVTCDVGFQPNVSSIACDEHGFWTNTPACVPFECDNIESSASIEVTSLSGTLLDATVTVTCSGGYQYVSGDTTRTCTLAGWSGTEITCSPIECFAPPSGTGASVHFTTTTHGSNATYSCDVAHDATGGDTVITCNAGTWTGTPLTCTIVDCYVPPGGSTGVISNYTTTTHGSRVTYSCDLGYDVVDGDVTLTCDSGFWIGTALTCTLFDCGAPPSTVTGVLAAYTTTTHGSNVTYDCDVGYDVKSGDASLTCDSGTWIGTPLSCEIIDCFTPNISLGVNATFTTTTHGATVTYTCDEGYDVISGDISMTCDSGNWVGVPLTCRITDCSMPPTGAEGAIYEFTTTTHGSIVTYRCNVGYDVTGGDPTLTCLSGNWTGTPLSCNLTVCSNPDINPGVLSYYTSATHGSTVSYICDVGYDVIGGDSTVTCDNGAWIGTPLSCALIDCYTPPLLNRVSASYTATTHGSSVTYTCDFGYDVTGGDAQIICDRGAWIGDPLSCNFTDCGDPPITTGVMAAYTSTSHGSDVTYSCEIGYDVTLGDNTSICDSGTWVGTPLTCSLIDCGTPPLLPGVITTYLLTTHGANVTYACDIGLVPVYGDEEITCVSGAWVGPPLVCELFDCLGPPMSDGLVADFTNTTHGSNVSYRCDIGYDVISGDTSLTCDIGIWVGTPLTCELIDCHAPVVNPGTVATYTSTTHGAVVTYTCDVGYESSDGNKTVTCDAGVWTGMPLACQLIDCLAPVPTLGVVMTFNSTTHGSLLTHECDVGYEWVSGMTSLTCDAGTWVGDPLQCGLIDCHEPPVATGASKNHTNTTHGSEATYTCDVGYDVNGGDSILTCDSGQWVGHTLNCSLINCFDPPDVTNAHADVSLTTHGSPVTYTCDVGYDGGTATLTCDAGVWVGAAPSCKPIDCFEPPELKGAIANFTFTTHRAVVTYTCDVGYENVTEMTSLTCDAGVWREHPPVCVLVECKKECKIEYGRINYTSFTYNSTASVTCDPSYTATHGYITCTADGRWDVTPSCTPNDCDSPVNVTGVLLYYTSTAHGAEVTSACDEGYDVMSGDATQRCEAGNWIGTPLNCSLIDCGLPRKVMNGRLLLEASTSYLSTATVQCRTGYVASTKRVTCQKNGKWSHHRCLLKARNATDIPSRIEGQVAVVVKVSRLPGYLKEEDVINVFRRQIAEAIENDTGIIFEEIRIETDGNVSIIHMILEESGLEGDKITAVGQGVRKKLGDLDNEVNVGGSTLRLIGDPELDIGLNETAPIDSNCFWYKFTGTCKNDNTCQTTNGQVHCSCTGDGCPIEETSGDPPSLVVPVVVAVCGVLLLLVAARCLVWAVGRRRRRKHKKGVSEDPYFYVPSTCSNSMYNRSTLYDNYSENISEKRLPAFIDNYTYSVGRYVVTSSAGGTGDVIYSEIPVNGRSDAIITGQPDFVHVPHERGSVILKRDREFPSLMT